MKAAVLNDLAASLKGCPFCGGPAKLGPMPGNKSWWTVQCVDWHCGGRNWAMDEPEKAVEAWNRRAEGGAT